MNTALTGVGRIRVAELDQRVDVAEAHLVGAGGDAVDRLERARRGVDGDVEPFGLEVALVDRDQERRRRAFELAVEREFDRRSGRTQRRSDSAAAARMQPGASRTDLEHRSCRYPLDVARPVRRRMSRRRCAQFRCSAKNMPNERARQDRDAGIGSAQTAYFLHTGMQSAAAAGNASRAGADRLENGVASRGSLPDERVMRRPAAARRTVPAFAAPYAPPDEDAGAGAAGRGSARRGGRSAHRRPRPRGWSRRSARSPAGSAASRTSCTPIRSRPRRAWR